MHARIFIITALCLMVVSLSAQERVTTFGIQFKPIIPANLFLTGSQTTIENDVDFTVSQNLGYVFGMVVRRGITKNFSFESGINSVQRNYNLRVSDRATGFTGNEDFRIVGYEIPAMLLAFVRLGEQVYMNTSLGAGIDFFPSNVGVWGHDHERAFKQVSFRTSWLQMAMLGNVGFEYRTRKSGYFYLGGSFHRPFTPVFISELEYQHLSTYANVWVALSGNYISLDLRYFFNEAPDPPKKKTKKKKK